jgi:hypothetical protein
MIQLFQDSTNVLPNYISVHPYGMAVYSVLVSVLVTAIGFLWRKLTAVEKISIEVIKDTSVTLANVAQRLEDQQQMKERQSAMLNNQNTILDKLEEIKQKDK